MVNSLICSDFVRSLLTDCIRVQGQYDGQRTVSSNGEKCLNWLNVSNAADYTTNKTGTFRSIVASCTNKFATSVAVYPLGELYAVEPPSHAVVEWPVFGCVCECATNNDFVGWAQKLHQPDLNRL